MQRIDTLVIGGGQAGLALSHELTGRGRDHVVIERGRAGERWRSERPPTLRLLSPNWMTRLPGFSYPGSDPDGYMSVGELVGHLDRWATSFGAPLRTETSVTGVERVADGYHVRTDRGTWLASNVVIATGHAQTPFVPPSGGSIDRRIDQVVPTRYRGPGDLAPGAVLVVGASATGLQIAEELAVAGRRTILSVGSHLRLPRRYRGMDILWWLDRMSLLDAGAGDVRGVDRARRQPSWQLVGRPEGGDMDLRTARRVGVELAGRFLGADGAVVRFADDLVESTSVADAALHRLLERIDDHVDETGLTAEVDAPVRPVAVDPGRGPERLDLRAAGVSTVVWATGYRRSYPWLHVPVLDRHGDIRQRRGVTSSPGLYTVGMRLQTCRGSATIDGVRHDAREIAARIDGAAPPLGPAVAGPHRTVEVDR